MSIVKVLPEFREGGGAQMALDEGLLETIDGSRTPDEVLKSTVEVVERRKKEHG